MSKFYAVNKGREIGVFRTWEECEPLVKGYVGAKYKKFNTLSEAEGFVAGASSSVTLPMVQVEKSKKRNLDDSEDEDGVVVFSDGACKGNGQLGSVAGVGVWWGHNDSRNIAERCPGAQTNNRAELIAIARVLETVPVTSAPLVIKSDSRYSIDCFSKWLAKWQRNNYRSSTGEPVKNAPLIRYIAAMLDARSRVGQKVRLSYVKAHCGIEGNEGADQQANIGTTLPAVEERDWEALEKDVKERALKQPNQAPEPVPVEIEPHEGGFKPREPVESPPRQRRRLSSPILSPVRVKPAVSDKISPEDLLLYAAGLSDDLDSDLKD